MDKAEIKKMIVAELKEAGLELAEDSAVQAVKALFSVAKKVVEATPNKTDDLLIPVLMVVEGPLLSLLDKIDGEDDSQV